MRPRSLIGPFVLIVLGALLLAHNLRPEWSLLDLLARSWPYLLIGWGLLRIGELVWWKAQGRMLPESGLTGGEWALVVLLSLLGTGGFYVRQHTPWERLGAIKVRGVEVFGETFDFPVAEQTLACTKTPRIVVENLRGMVRVTGVEEEKVVVSGKTEVRALQKREAEQAHAAAALEVSGTAEEVFIRTNQERITGEARLRTDLEIRAPKGASVTVRGRLGDVELADVGGTLEVISDNAGVRVQRAGGDVRVNLRASDIVRVAGARGNVVIEGRGRDIELEDVEGSVTISGSYSGDLALRRVARTVRFESRNTEFQAEKLPGEIRFDLGDFEAVHLVGPVRLKTRSKDVKIEDFTARLELEVDRGDVEIRPRQATVPDMEIKVRSGNIKLTLPLQARFQLNARAERGEVTNRYGEAVKVETLERGGRLVVEQRGAPLVQVVTSRGNVTIQSEGGMPAPPQAAPPRAPRAPKPPAASETF